MADKKHALAQHEVSVPPDLTTTFKYLLFLCIFTIDSKGTQRRKEILSKNETHSTFNIVTYTTDVWCGVTNNTTRVRIGYRIYSLWRFITAADYNY
jgi:hypothetical protein